MSFYATIWKDIELDADGDLKIGADGDFSLTESNQVDVEHILISAPGNWREFPAVGVAIHRYINSTGQVTGRIGLQRKIRLQLENDNMEVGQLVIEQGSNGQAIINVTAKRIR